MHQLRSEEKAALLLPTADDDDDDNNNDNNNHEMINSPRKIAHDNFPVVAKRPKSYHRHRSSGTHPVLCFALILGAFVLGCISGVVIMLYRMSQDAEQRVLPNSSQPATNIDLSIRTKLIQSITKTNFQNLNNEMESQNNSANKLYEQWQSLSPSLVRVNKYSYDIDLSKYAPLNQWSGIQLLDGKSEKELLKIDRLSTDSFLSFSSLVKSGTINGNSIYYVNYGRQEDFAYLFQKRVRFNEQEKSIVFMRRKATILSQTEQIHQAIHYGFDGLVLFDDNENQQTTTTNDRHPFVQEWSRYSGIKERQKNLLDGVSSDKEHSISLLILPFDDVQRIFVSLQPDSNQWLSCPNQWHNKSTPLKIGGTLSSFKLRLVVNLQEIKVQLPVVMSSIRGTIDPDRFIMVGYQLGFRQQNKILNEIVQAYTNQIKNGWKPKRSILFCAWSGLEYDQYTIRRWLSENSRLIDRNLIAYIDLGNGILANSTLNLHGSPLLEQIAHYAADSVPSPLQHNHTCHHRQMTTMAPSEENHHHDHGRKRRDGGHEHPMETNEQEANECEPHKLLDEWFRASRNQFGSNKSSPIVQSIDTDSTAALFQLQYGIPAILIEMTEEKALTNDTFYVRYSSPVSDQKIQAEVYVAYTQFISEIIRQLIDEPLISFNLTNYADQIDKQVVEYFAHYDRAYDSLSYQLGDRNEFTKTLHDLTKTMRQIQSRIDQTPRNDYIRLQSLNKQLTEVERLFLTNDQLRGMNSPDKIYKHVLIGPAFGLTNTVVPFPSLSNILYDIPGDPATELCDALKLYWSKFKEQIDVINRTLNGIDGLFTKDK